MKVLLIGSGAREHALSWKLSRSKVVKQLWVWPGGPAMEVSGAVRFDAPLGCPWEDICDRALANGIDFIVVGPEQPMAEGLADIALTKGLRVFGPVRRGAELESSKAFAKDVMAGAGIPTARYVTVSSRAQCEEAAQHELQQRGGVVLKASGLAAGKGVFVCQSIEDIKNGLHHLYDTGMKTAAATVVVEELLVGRECSYFTCLGQDGATPLGFAVDYKRLEEGDQGPNTGGMGCYTPVPWLPENASDTVHQLVVEPLLAELKRRDIPYTGCLYVGLMWTSQGPKVVEFNVRFGDPEAQVLAVHDDRDWGALMARKVGFPIDAAGFGWQLPVTSHRTVAVVMASRGYPYGEGEADACDLPREIFRNEMPTPVIFGAAVRATKDGMGLETGRGRVLTVVARSSDFRAARIAAFQKVSEIQSHWTTCRYRRDIGEAVQEK